MARFGGRKLRWAPLVALACVVFTSCSPAEPSARIVNVEVLESGSVALLGSAAFPESEREVSERSIDWTVLTELCLDGSPSDCARITLGTGHLEESRDGGESWSWHRLKSALGTDDLQRRVLTPGAAGTISSFAALPAMVLTTAALYYEGGFGWFFLAAIFIGGPFAVVSLMITLRTALRCFASDRNAALITLRNSLLTLVLFGAWLFVVALLWNWVLIGWHTAILAGAVAAAASLAFAARPATLDIADPVPVDAGAP